MDSTSTNENQAPGQPAPVKNDNASPQVYVITPNQLAKLGLSTQIHSLIATQTPSNQTAVEMDNNDEQSNISLSTASHLEKDITSSCLMKTEISNEIRASVDAENTPSSLRNEMKSKLYHLLNTNPNTSVIKDSNKIQILNYTTPTPSSMCDATYSTIADKRNILDANAKTISPRVNTMAEQKKPYIAGGTEIRHDKILPKQFSDYAVKQIVKPARIIFTPKPSSEATKTTPLKFEIVSNEIVNFSPLEIRNILEKNAPSQSKMTISIPQSTSNTTINKTAYLQNTLCTQDGATNRVEKHFKKKLYETFHVADSATVEKQSNDTDKVFDLDNKPEEYSDSKCQRDVENAIVSLPRIQTLNLYDKKDKYSFLPPENTFVVRQAQIQILNSSWTPTEQVRPECTNEEKSVSEKQDDQTDTKLTTSIDIFERENKKAAVTINNNNTALKATEDKNVQTSPTLLNSLLQRRVYIGTSFGTDNSDHTSLNVLKRLTKVEKKQSEADVDDVKENNSIEKQTKEINISPEFYEKDTKIVDNHSVNEQESFTLETVLLNNDSQTEQVREVGKAPPPRILNLELQDKKEVGLKVEKRQHKPNFSLSTEQIEDISIISEFPGKPASTDIVDRNSEKVSVNSETEQEQIDKTPTPPPRVLNLELQEREKVITDNSFFDSTAVSSSSLKKENLQTSKEKVDASEEQKSGAASVKQSSKQHQDLLKKINTLPTQPNPTKSNTTKKIQYKLFSIARNDIPRYIKAKNANAVKSDDSSSECDCDSDKVNSDVDTTLEISSLENISDLDKINSDGDAITLGSLESNSDSDKVNSVVDTTALKLKNLESNSDLDKDPSAKLNSLECNSDSDKVASDVDAITLSSLESNTDLDKDPSDVDPTVPKLDSLECISDSDKIASDVDVITLSSLECNSDSDKVASDVDRSIPELKYRKHLKKVNTSVTRQKTRTQRTSENSSDNSDQQSDVIIIDADETTFEQNTKKKQEENTPKPKKPSDIDLYVQSKTSGRKRKYVDYKVLSGISKDSSSDSDSANEDAPRKIGVAEKLTDLINQDKSTEEIPVKKRGRGRPRKSEIKPSEYDIQIYLETSECNVLNSKIEKQCDSSAVGDYNSVQSERSFQRASIIISTPLEKKLRGRRRKNTIKKTKASDGANTNPKSERKTDSSILGAPKRKHTVDLLSKPTIESESIEKRLRRHTKVLSEKMNSAEETLETPQKKQDTKAGPKSLKLKKELFLKSADSSEKDSEPIVQKKRRGRPRKQVEAEELNSTGDTKSKKKGRRRLRKSKKLTENSKKVLLRKKPRGRPKKINKNNSQSEENKTKFKKSKTKSESKKPKIAEVNLSEDGESSDVEFMNLNLNSLTDPLDTEGEWNDQAEPELSTNNLKYTKDSPSDSPEKKGKPTEKKRRDHPKIVINESEQEMEKNLQIKDAHSFTKSKFVKKQINTGDVELKKELETASVTVEPPKQRGRKRKIVFTGKELEESNNVTCAVCKFVLDESQWKNHNELKHNNLAWKTNEDPLDLNDQVLVERILSDLYKCKKFLHCELCECKIETLSGYTEHKKTCTQKSDDATEPAVKKKLLSVRDSLFSNTLMPIEEGELISTGSTSAMEERDQGATDSKSAEEIPPLPGTNYVRCGICKNAMPKGQWPSHKQRKHNNLAWKVGEKPLDLNNRSIVMRTLTGLCKNKKPLFCEICDISKKSVLGYLSHKSQCQKSDNEINALKVTCNLCGRSMLPVSLQRHIALTHSVNVKETVSPSRELIISKSDIQGKRKAANKAAGLIHSFVKDMLNEVNNTKFKKYVKNVNFRSVEAAMYKFSEDIRKQSYTVCVFDDCNYRTSEHEDLFYHIENCDKNSDTNYTCNFCLATFKARQSVRDHIKLTHRNNENRTLISQVSDNEFNSKSEDDYENDNISDSELIHTGDENPDFPNADTFIVNRPRKIQASSSGKSSNHRIHFLQKSGKKPKGIYLNAYWWMEKFCKDNYKLQNSFTKIYCKKEDWIQIDPTQIINYLPKLRYSVDTARITINNIVNPICYEYVWKKYKLFESETLSNDGSSIFFCGGPINALAWVPTPHTETKCDQILAVSVTPDPDIKYNTNAVYRDAGLIQFWNIGVLHNRGISTCQPKLEFSIAHHYGVIWAMEWCPSGCYDLIMTNDIRRLGLLAIACSNSFVYIYLVPHPGQISGKIFRTKPVYKLQLENFTDLMVGEIDYYSTRLSWCKTYGHQFLAVGYSNGVVAFYDLKTEASLLKTESDGIITLKPVKQFRPHLDAITALCLFHLHNGKRWLLTGSLDRDCKLWDLENITKPIHYCKKFVVTDAAWLIHWLCSVYSYDHGNISGAVPTSLNPARDFFASCTSFMPSNSRVTSIAANEWANLFIQVNDCGEVICGFPDQLLQGYDSDKKKSLRKSRCLASYTGMVPKSIPSSERIKLEAAKLKTLKKQHLNSSAGKNFKKQSAHCGVSNGSSETRTYFEAEQKYGLVFCDLNMDCKSKEPTAELNKLLQSTHYFSLAKPDVYPLQSITKVSSNPNKNSFLYYACGYQVGIIRVSNLKFLCPESEQNVLIR